jgi:hypothetical protein
LKVKLQYLDVLGPKDIETAFRAASKGRAEAILMMVPGAIAGGHRTEIAELAVKSWLPVIYNRRESVETGGAYVLRRERQRFGPARRYVCGQDS